MSSWGPDWWHSHGAKMNIKHLNINGYCPSLKLQASAAELEVRRNYLVEENVNVRIWELHWRVVQSYPEGCESRGKTIVYDDGLRKAFGLDDSFDLAGEFIIKKYKAVTTARWGCFIRYKEFLNIPCPGTGCDGDPNVSVLVTEEIQEAITKMLALK